MKRTVIIGLLCLSCGQHGPSSLSEEAKPNFASPEELKAPKVEDLPNFDAARELVLAVGEVEWNSIVANVPHIASSEADTWPKKCLKNKIALIKPKVQGFKNDHLSVLETISISAQECPEERKADQQDIRLGFKSTTAIAFEIICEGNDLSSLQGLSVSDESFTTELKRLCVNDRFQTRSHIRTKASYKIEFPNKAQPEKDYTLNAEVDTYSAFAAADGSSCAYTKRPDGFFAAPSCIHVYSRNPNFAEAGQAPQQFDAATARKRLFIMRDGSNLPAIPGGTYADSTTLPFFVNKWSGTATFAKDQFHSFLRWNLKYSEQGVERSESGEFILPKG